MIWFGWMKINKNFNMILVRLRHNNRPEIVFEGSEKDIIYKIHELNLCDYHDRYFYERGKFENLGLGGDEYDYYTIYENYKNLVEMPNILGD